MPQAAAYSVAAPETLRFSIPAEALVSRRSISAAEPLTLAVNETNGAPALLGTLTHSSSLREDAVQRTALELQVAPSDDVWVTSFTDDVVAALRASVYSVSNGSRGWDAVAQPALADNFTRLNDSTLAISAASRSSTCAPPAERIRVEVPAVAVASHVPRIVERSSRRPRRVTLALGGTRAADRRRRRRLCVAPRAGRARDGGARQQRHLARDRAARVHVADGDVAV